MTKKKNIIADDIKALIENEDVYITNNPKIINIYSIYLSHEIGEAKNYRDVYNILRESDSTDNFNIYLNNYGGYVSTGLDIINSMKACPGKVQTCMTGPCYSMAPLIALAGQIVYVEEDVFMMFHDYSGGDEGKGNEMAARISHEKPHFDNMFRKITKGFLTIRETEFVLKGQDLYLGKPEILKRLKRIKKLGVGGINK